MENEIGETTSMTNTPSQAHLQGIQSQHTKANLAKEPAFVPTLLVHTLSALAAVPTIQLQFQMDLNHFVDSVCGVNSLFLIN